MQEHSDKRYARRRMTLVELFMTIVVVGVLIAVAIIGFHSLETSSANAACLATLSAATLASSAFYAHLGIYPQTFAELTNRRSGQPLLDANNLTETATTLKSGNGWTLQLIPGATTSDQTRFQC